MNNTPPLPLDEQGAQEQVRGLLAQLGLDVNSPDMKDTPKRWLKMMREVQHKEAWNFTVFESETDDLILVRNIDFTSMCEHHLLPFFGTAHVGYYPDGKIAGISKLGRAVRQFAAGFQNQERITGKCGKFLDEKLNPKGVVVILQAEHTCMTVRGLKSPRAQTTTIYRSGVFQDAAVMKEVLDLIKI